MKNKKTIIGIIVTVVVIAVTVTLAIIYKNEIADIIGTVKEKIEEKKNAYCAKREFADYADVD